MEAADIEGALAGDDPVEICRALRYLAGPRSGPRYPQARVMALLGPRYPDRVRENALVLVLRKGQHPLEDRRILDLLVTASRRLLATLLGHVCELAFPSAAEDTLSWCWERRLHQEDRLNLLRAVESLGPRVAQRFLRRFRLLELPNPLLQSAALGLLARVDPPDTRPIFEDALAQANPRLKTTALEYLAPRWSNPERRQQLPALMKDPHHRVRSTAAVLAYRDDPEASLRVLGSMAEDRHPLTRAAAAWGLSSLVEADPRCRGFLERLGEDADARVARRARASLRRGAA